MMSRLTAFFLGIILPSLLLAAAPSFEELFKRPATDKPKSGGWIYFTDGKDLAIRKAEIDGPAVVNFINKDLASPSGIAINETDGMLYWSDVKTHKIERAPLNDATKREVVLEGLNHPYALQIDEKQGRIYWSDPIEDAIFHANLDGTNKTKLLGKEMGLENPRGLDLVPEQGKIYWADSYHNCIMRANLDGSNVERVLSGLQKPYDVDVVPEKNQMYWSSSFDDKIMKADLNGANQQVHGEVNIPVALEYDEKSETLFWTTIYPPRIGGTEVVVWKTINPKDLVITYDKKVEEIELIEDEFYP